MDGTVTRTYVADDTGRIVRFCDPDCTGANPVYLVAWNAHGDAVSIGLLDPATGGVTPANRFSYATWGTPTTTAVNGHPDLGFRYLWVGAAGVAWDNSAGQALYDMHARTYSPVLGRFLQPDPARADGNLYAYAGNDPVTRSDPSGLVPDGNDVLVWRVERMFYWWDAWLHNVILPGLALFNPTSYVANPGIALWVGLLAEGASSEVLNAIENESSAFGPAQVGDRVVAKVIMNLPTRKVRVQIWYVRQGRWTLVTVKYFHTRRAGIGNPFSCANAIHDTLMEHWPDWNEECRAGSASDSWPRYQLRWRVGRTGSVTTDDHGRHRPRPLRRDHLPHEVRRCGRPSDAAGAQAQAGWCDSVRRDCGSGHRARVRRLVCDRGRAARHGHLDCSLGGSPKAGPPESSPAAGAPRHTAGVTHLSQGAASTASGDRLEMAYDADGHRTQLREVTAGTLTRTRDLRYQGDAIVEERVTDAAHPAGAVVRTYTVTDTGQVVSMTIAAGEPGADPTVPRTYLPTWNGHGDALALWRLEDDGTLSLANSFTYTTWGRPTTATHNGIGDLGFRLLYVGAQDVQWDDFSGAGLLYMHARHYSPLTGRFLQPDPSAAEANLYTYAGDSPVTKVDPSGLCGPCARLLELLQRLGTWMTNTGGWQKLTAFTNGARTMAPIVGSKLDFLLGKSGGVNAPRSVSLMLQLRRIGIVDTPAWRSYLEVHLQRIALSSSNIVGTQVTGTGGGVMVTRVIKESLLAGPNGFLKMESVWEFNPYLGAPRLITVKLFGGRGQ